MDCQGEKLCQIMIFWAANVLPRLDLYGSRIHIIVIVEERQYPGNRFSKNWKCDSVGSKSNGGSYIILHVIWTSLPNSEGMSAFSALQCTWRSTRYQPLLTSFSECRCAWVIEEGNHWPMESTTGFKSRSNNDIEILEGFVALSQREEGRPWAAPTVRKCFNEHQNEQWIL